MRILAKVVEYSSLAWKNRRFGEMFISLEQIKAARALLNWNQKDLAHYAGLKVDQVHSFESGRTKSLDVLHNIYECFSAHGIDFKDGGVLPFQVSSFLLDTYMEVLIDVEKTIKSGDELLKHCADDRLISADIAQKLEEMRGKGIEQRITISDENEYIVGRAIDYRMIPATYVNNAESPMFIYANKVVFYTDGKFMVIVSKSLSKQYREQFEFWWSQGKKITNTRSKSTNKMHAANS